MYDDRIDFTFLVDAEKYFAIRIFEKWMRYIAGEDIDNQESSNENDQTKSLDDLKAKITELEGAVLYAKAETENFIGLWEDSSYTFVEDNKKARLLIYCIYTRNLTNDVFGERLAVTLMTEDYYRSHVIDRFEITRQFNTKFIKDYIFN